MLFDRLFRKRRPEPVTPPYNPTIEELLAKLSQACNNCRSYSKVLNSVYYDTAHEKYSVKFECLMLVGKGPGKGTYLELRRAEFLYGVSLVDLLDFAVTYAAYPDAFIRSPMGNLPKGVTWRAKSFKKHLFSAR